MPSPITLLIESTEEIVIKDEQNLTLSNKLKVFRAQHNLTQEQLAEKIGVSRQTVNAIESNKYLPSLGLAFKIARLFNTGIENIFIYDQKKSDNEI